MTMSCLPMSRPPCSCWLSSLPCLRASVPLCQLVASRPVSMKMLSSPCAKSLAASPPAREMAPACLLFDKGGLLLSLTGLLVPSDGVLFRTFRGRNGGSDLILHHSILHIIKNSQRGLRSMKSCLGCGNRLALSRRVAPVSGCVRGLSHMVASSRRS